MRKVSKNVYAEVLVRGCNPSFLVTTDGVVMFDTPQEPIDALRWRERLEEFGPIRNLVNTEPHPDHIRGNAFFPGVEVVGQRGMVARYQAAIPMMTSDETIERLKETDPDSVWLVNHPDYPPNPPTRIFDEELTLHVGNHTVNCYHTPGHTAPQTAIHLPDEGVVICGDTVFHKVQTWLQEADPWALIDTLKRLHSFDAEVVIPGHGEQCPPSYFAQQIKVVESWVGAVEDLVKRGLSEAEALKNMPSPDPWPAQQMQYMMYDRIKELSLSNLYKRIAEKLNLK